MQISLDAYRVFYQVARHRSFTKAAQSLYTNQPNVTRSIKHLESALGCSLFDRTSRHVQLTPEGEALYACIAPAMHQIAAGEEQLRLHTALKGGSLRIGVSETALHHVLLPVLEAFRQQYPGIHLRILNSNSPQAVTALKEHQVDFCLLTLPVDLDDRYEQRDLLQFREVPVCGNTLAFSLSAPQSLENLSRYPLISLCKGSASYRFYENWFRQHGAAFSPDIEAATSDQIPPMVKANLGIGFISELAANNAAGKHLHILTLQEPLPLRTISLIKRTDAPLSIAAAKLEEMLLDSQR